MIEVKKTDRVRWQRSGAETELLFFDGGWLWVEATGGEVTEGGSDWPWIRKFVWCCFAIGRFEADNKFWVLMSASRYSERSQSETAGNEGWLYLFFESIFLWIWQLTSCYYQCASIMFNCWSVLFVWLYLLCKVMALFCSVLCCNLKCFLFLLLLLEAFQNILNFNLPIAFCRVWNFSQISEFHKLGVTPLYTTSWFAFNCLMFTPLFCFPFEACVYHCLHIFVGFISHHTSQFCFRVLENLRML